MKIKNEPQMNTNETQIAPREGREGARSKVFFKAFATFAFFARLQSVFYLCFICVHLCSSVANVIQ